MSFANHIFLGLCPSCYYRNFFANMLWGKVARENRLAYEVGGRKRWEDNWKHPEK